MFFNFTPLICAHGFYYDRQLCLYCVGVFPVSLLNMAENFEQFSKPHMVATSDMGSVVVSSSSAEWLIRSEIKY